MANKQTNKQTNELDATKCISNLRYAGENSATKFKKLNGFIIFIFACFKIALSFVFSYKIGLSFTTMLTQCSRSSNFADTHT